MRAVPAMSAMIMSVLWIVPPKYAQQVGDAAFGKAPIGTGPFKFKEWRRGEVVENGMQPCRETEVIARLLVQFQSLDELAQHVGQSPGGSPSLRQLLPLLVAVYDPPKDIVCAGNHLQWLAQIVPRHRQQRRGKLAVPLVCIAVHCAADAPRVPAGG